MTTAKLATKRSIVALLVPLWIALDSFPISVQFQISEQRVSLEQTIETFEALTVLLALIVIVHFHYVSLKVVEKLERCDATRIYVKDRVVEVRRCRSLTDIEILFTVVNIVEVAIDKLWELFLEVVRVSVELFANSCTKSLV